VSTNVTPHLFWVTSRAAGVVAPILACIAVCVGLITSTKLIRRRGPDLLATHEALSLATIVAVIVHGAALLGDRYLHPSVADIAIALLGSYETFWTALGILGGSAVALLMLRTTRAAGVAPARTAYSATIRPRREARAGARP
jgi:hypothetical protein